MNMNQRWYKRLFLSYFPVFFIAISTILFLSFLLVSEVSKKEAEKASRISSRYVVDTVESSLRNVELTVLKELTANASFKEFFDPKPETDPRIVQFKLSEDAKSIVTNHYLIHSIYFYRYHDGMVLTQGSAEQVERFTDKPFILKAQEQGLQAGWSSPRMFREFISEPEEKVITLTKKALLPFGNQGLVVVNVRVHELLRVIDELADGRLTFMEVSNAGGTIYPSLPSALQESERKVLSEVSSAYLGWTFTSGLKAGQLFGWVSVISYLWAGIGVAVLVLCIVYLVYITKRNYKPIEIIMHRIQEYQQRNVLQGKPTGDEFSFIEKALESLIDQTTVYEKQFQEDLLLRRRQFFQELISGARDMNARDGRARLERLQLPSDFELHCLAVAEIDRYPQFLQQYSERDQQLMKFVLTNVVHEFAQQESISLWTEWITNERLGILFVIPAANGDTEEQVKQINERFRQWVETNLNFSITIGMGRIGEELTNLSQAYMEALFPLNHKLTLGSNRVLTASTPRHIPSKGSYQYYQRVSALVQHYRMTNPLWSDVLNDIFSHLSSDMLKDEEIRSLVDYMLHLLHRELEELPEEVRRSWEETYPALLQATAEAQTIEAIRDAQLTCLQQWFDRYVAFRDSKSQASLLDEMKRYIETHYTDPDLSLNHLSDRFDINPKYASQLFKEQFGMKFVDFLVQLRMEQAKRLLLETSDPIQDIAEKVGYTHGISFGRTFKKVVGATPGDYRKLM
jgi:two-component system, response regulator YesN